MIFYDAIKSNVIDAKHSIVKCPETIGNSELNIRKSHASKCWPTAVSAVHPHGAPRATELRMCERKKGIGNKNIIALDSEVNR